MVTDDRIRFAYAEFFLALEVVRRSGFRLFDTTWECDVDSVRDCFIGESHPDSRGVRVEIVGLRPQELAMGIGR